MPRLAAVPADSSSREFLLSTEACLQSADADLQYAVPQFLKGENDGQSRDGNNQNYIEQGDVVGQSFSNRVDILEYQFTKQETLLREMFDMQQATLTESFIELWSQVRHDMKRLLSEHHPEKNKSPFSSSESLGDITEGGFKSERSDYFVKKSKSDGTTFGVEETIPYASEVEEIEGYKSLITSEEVYSDGESIISEDPEDLNLAMAEEMSRDDCCSGCLRCARRCIPKDPTNEFGKRATRFVNDLSRSRNSVNADDVVLPSEWWASERIVRSNWFLAVTCALISCNAIYMGLSANNDMYRQTLRFAGRENVPLQDTQKIDVIFSVIFFIELILRIWGFGFVFFCGAEWPWNLFDAATVLLSLAQVCLAPFFNTEGLRVVRIVRVMRVLFSLRKVPCLRKLEHMLVAVFNTIPALAPAVLMLVLMMYVFVVFFMQGLDNYLDGIDPNAGDSGVDDLIIAFGSVTNALETLFLSVVGGRNWDGLLVALRRVGPLYEITFPLYVGFVTFAVLNILTGIFVDAAQQFSSMDRELAVELQVDKEKEYVRGLMKLFAEADVDKSGTLTWDEFMEHFESNEVRAYLKGMDLNVTSAKKIFNLIDGDNTGEIGIQAFLETCLQLRGTAQVVDIVIMRSDMENMIEQKINMMLEKVGSLKKLTTKAFRDMKHSRTNVRGSVRLGQMAPFVSQVASQRSTKGTSAVGHMASVRSCGTQGGGRRSQASVGSPYNLLSPSIRTLNSDVSYRPPVDLGSYGAYKSDGTGITGLRNTLLVVDEQL